MIVDDIIDGIADAVANCTPATDSSSPSAFAHAGAFAALELGVADDRAFIVRLDRGNPDAWHEGTSTTGIGQYAVLVNVQVRYRNEGREVFEQEKIIAQDRRIIIDNVPVYMRDLVVSGGTIGVCVYEGGHLSEETTEIVHSHFTFRVEYTDTITAVP